MSISNHTAATLMAAHIQDTTDASGTPRNRRPSGWISMLTIAGLALIVLAVSHLFGGAR